MFDEITDFQKLRLHEGEVLIVKLPLGDRTSGAWHRYAKELRDVLGTMLLTNNILVLADDINFTVIEKENTDRDYTEHF